MQKAGGFTAARALGSSAPSERHGYFAWRNTLSRAFRQPAPTAADSSSACPDHVNPWRRDR